MPGCTDFDRAASPHDRNRRCSSEREKAEAEQREMAGVRRRVALTLDACRSPMRSRWGDNRSVANVVQSFVSRASPHGAGAHARDLAARESSRELAAHGDRAPRAVRRAWRIHACSRGRRCHRDARRGLRWATVGRMVDRRRGRRAPPLRVVRGRTRGAVVVRRVRRGLGPSARDRSIAARSRIRAGLRDPAVPVRAEAVASRRARRLSSAARRVRSTG